LGIYSTLLELVLYCPVLANFQKKDKQASKLASDYRNEDLLTLQMKIKSEPNLLRDHIQGPKVIRQCALGRDMISVMSRNAMVATRAEGCKLGQRLVERGLLDPIIGGRSFTDSTQLYRFVDALPPPTSPTMGRK